jgi:hypothetical protein
MNTDLRNGQMRSKGASHEVANYGFKEETFPSQFHMNAWAILFFLNVIDPDETLKRFCNGNFS